MRKKVRNMNVTNVLSTEEGIPPYMILLPGKIKQVNGKYNLSLEQREMLFGTVVGGLVTGDKIMYLDVQDVRLPIPQQELHTLMPQEMYDDRDVFIGTTIRLGNIATACNKVLIAVNAGLDPRFDVLEKSYLLEMNSLIDNEVLRTRYPIGVSAPAMGADYTLTPGQVGITKNLAFCLLEDLKKSLSQRESMLLDKQTASYGVGVLSGYSMYYLRNPSTVRGAITSMELIVVDAPGNAILTTSIDQELAGGDYDGDQAYVFSDESKEHLLSYCLKSHGSIRKREERFEIGTRFSSKNGDIKSVDLSTIDWQQENELSILADFKGKELIGQAWVGLVHYQFLYAHELGDNAEETLSERLLACYNYAVENNSVDIFDLCSAYVREKQALNDPGRLESLWVEIAYTAIAEAYFNIYESIFDLRKGDSDLPYDPEQVLQSLMGRKNPDWNKLAAGGIWIEPLMSVYKLVPEVEVVTERYTFTAKSMEEAMNKFPVFDVLLHHRTDRLLYIRSLIDQGEDFSAMLTKGLLEGN